jgi:hypothetical protein
MLYQETVWLAILEAAPHDIPSFLSESEHPQTHSPSSCEVPKKTHLPERTFKCRHPQLLLKYKGLTLLIFSTVSLLANVDLLPRRHRTLQSVTNFCQESSHQYPPKTTTLVLSAAKSIQVPSVIHSSLAYYFIQKSVLNAMRDSDRMAAESYNQGYQDALVELLEECMILKYVADICTDGPKLHLATRDVSLISPGETPQAGSLRGIRAFKLQTHQPKK